MKIVEQLSDTGASEASLKDLEASLGATLPADYREFMSEYNGGRPEPRGFVFETSEGSSDSFVRYFLTLDTKEEGYTIQKFLNRYFERVPQKLLPIACDSFGNLVLLDLGARSKGNVYFWDHELEGTDDESESDELESMDDEPTWMNISVIAPSFTEFLELLE